MHLRQLPVPLTLSPPFQRVTLLGRPMGVVLKLPVEIGSLHWLISLGLPPAHPSTLLSRDTAKIYWYLKLPWVPCKLPHHFLSYIRLAQSRLWSHGRHIQALDIYYFERRFVWLRVDLELKTRNPLLNFLLIKLREHRCPLPCQYLVVPNFLQSLGQGIRTVCFKVV